MRVLVHPLMHAMALWALVPVAQAAPPLLVAAEVAGTNLQVYVRDGSLTLTQPKEDGSRIALRPLVGETPGPIPPDLGAWREIEYGSCHGTPTHRWTHRASEALVRGAGSWELPAVEVVVAGTIVATGIVGRPAQLCALHVENVDSIPGQEVIVLWQTSQAGKEKGPNTQGVSVLRIPETAQ
jgi:hypothetical protein